MSNKEPISWFTSKTGRRIPIFEGESKADAVKRTFSKSENNNSKNRQIEQSRKEADRLNKESNYQNELKKGGAVQRKNGKLFFKGKEMESLDVSEANAEDGDSLGKYVKNGKLSEERQEVHRQIIENYFKGHTPYAPGEEKVAMFTGGGGASGKGGFSRDAGKYYSQNRNPLVVDSDEIKHALAKADGLSLNDKLTRYYHEESSSLAKQIYTTALQHNYPVMFDGTATNPKSVLKKLAQAEAKGYKTEMCFLFSDFATVRNNSLKRYKKERRFVPPAALLGAHKNAYKAVMALEGKFDSVKIYDNAGHKMKLVGKGSKNKKIQILDPSGWKRFKNVENEFTLTDAQMKAWLDDKNKISSEFKKSRK